MKKSYKAGIWAIIVAIPALVLLFLYVFGKNYYTLPVYYATDSVKVGGHYKITAAHSIPPFYFRNQNNKIFNSDTLNGKFYVADFFFTRCPGICPKMTNNLSRVQETFREEKDFRIVSFTVDPKNDTVAALKNYATQYKADPAIWNFLTGTKDSLYTLAQKGFFLSAMEDEKPAEFIHSDKLVLVDKSGRIRGYYNGTDKEDVDRLIREIQVLIYSYEHEQNN
jgi:protein SCO1